MTSPLENCRWWRKVGAIYEFVFTWIEGRVLLMTILFLSSYNKRSQLQKYQREHSLSSMIRLLRARKKGPISQIIKIYRNVRNRKIGSLYRYD
jgi:hypothetical protein